MKLKLKAKIRFKFNFLYQLKKIDGIININKLIKKIVDNHK